MNGTPPHVGRRKARALARGAARWPLAVLSTLCLLAAGLALAATPDAAAKPASAADCQSLLHQFDVAWAAHRDDPRATAARHSRDLGDVSCSQRHYADGVHLIRRALHDIGVKPVKIVSATPSH